MVTLYSRPPQGSKEFCVLKIGVRNKNGRTYDQATVKQGVGEFLNRPSPHLGTFMEHAGFNLDIDKVSHIIENVEIRGTRVFAKIKPVKTPQGEILEELMANDLVEFRTAGTYTHLENGYVRNWTMLSVSVVAKGQGA